MEHVLDALDNALESRQKDIRKLVYEVDKVKGDLKMRKILYNNLADKYNDLVKYIEKGIAKGKKMQFPWPCPPEQHIDVNKED